MLSIILTVCGLWALVTGKVPSALFGGPRYRIEGMGARVIGAILVLPMPIGFVSGVVLGVLMGDKGIDLAWAVEVIIFILAVLSALVISRFVRKPVVAV